jgi:predicted nucleic acid-binding protein
LSVVVDSSVVVAALVGAGAEGEWAEAVLAEGGLAAPHLMPVEAANILRRAALARQISPDVAALAHQDLLRLRVHLFPYAPIAERIWQLRVNLTAYDAWYVALAEQLGVGFATLDVRLSRAPGLGCDILVPGETGD